MGKTGLLDCKAEPSYGWLGSATSGWLALNYRDARYEADGWGVELGAAPIWVLGIPPDVAAPNADPGGICRHCNEWRTHLALCNGI